MTVEPWTRLSASEQLRLAALRLAVDNASADGRTRVPADEIVGDARQFLAFLSLRGSA